MARHGSALAVGLDTVRVQPLRALLTGRSATPGLFEVMSLLGREACLRRLTRAAAVFAAA